MARRKARAAGFEGAYASIEGKKSVLGVGCKSAMRKQT